MNHVIPSLHCEVDRHGQARIARKDTQRKGRALPIALNETSKTYPVERIDMRLTVPLPFGRYILTPEDLPHEH